METTFLAVFTTGVHEIAIKIIIKIKLLDLTLKIVKIIESAEMAFKIQVKIVLTLIIKSYLTQIYSTCNVFSSFNILSQILAHILNFYCTF